MGRFEIPEAVLANHTAILGKTGSGKTSTSKLFVERIVEGGQRVCVLDPIKSDWWGITSSADGRSAGLPFGILGGPRGHAPLQSSSGSVVGRLVAEGRIPLSIVDMAHFEPGGLQRFFVDFAEGMMRHMRGVLYLVVEEAHEFAPKERAGIGGENMTLHWAKRLATAGRSKGVRLLVATQRVQSLHNAVLGSCETIVAHRLTTPADQKPVVDWLKANTDKATADAVSASLSSLPTGTGWLCSGEAKIFERVAFPKFRTYDNAATPTTDSEERSVQTAPVDRAQLQALLGVVSDEAMPDDPKALRAEIERLKKAGAAIVTGYTEADVAREVEAAVKPHRDRVEHLEFVVRELREVFDRSASILATESFLGGAHRSATSHDIPAEMKVVSETEGEVTDAELRWSRPQQAILDALASLASLGISSPLRSHVALFAEASPTSSSFGNNLGALRTGGLIHYPSKGLVSLTASGSSTARRMEVPPTIKRLHERWYSILSNPQSAIVRELVRGYPGRLGREALADRTGASATSSSYGNNLGYLRSLGLIDYPERGYVVATSLLFPEGLE